MVTYYFDYGYTLDYFPQTETTGATHLATFILKRNGKEVERYTTNYVPSRAFPLEDTVMEVTKMLVHEDAWKDFFKNTLVHESGKRCKKGGAQQ